MALNPPFLQRITDHCTMDIEKVVKNVFDFPEPRFVQIHLSKFDSRKFILQQALHKALPLLETEGAVAVSKRPVFYGNNLSRRMKNFSKWYSQCAQFLN